MIASPEAGQPSALRPQRRGGDEFPLVLVAHGAPVWGGAEASLLEALRGLIAIESEIKTLVLCPPGPLLTALLNQGERARAFVPLPAKRPRTSGQAWRQARSWRTGVLALRRELKSSGAALLHCNSGASLLAGWPAARLTRRLVSWHARDLVWPRPVLALAARADASLAISGCVARALTRNGVPAPSVTVVPNPVDLDFWSTRRTASMGHDLLFGAVGQLVGWKRHEIFVEAAALVREQLPGARFRLIAPNLWGQADIEKRLRALVQARHEQGVFELHGGQTDARAAIDALDCLVHAAANEPWGRVVAEALALQKPVVACNSCGPAELIHHERTGLLVPTLDSPRDQAKALAEAMLRVAREPHERAQWGRAGRQTLSQHHDHRTAALALANAWKDALTRH